MVQFVGIETPDPTKGRQRYPTTPQLPAATSTQQDYMSTPKASGQQQYQYSRSQNSPVRTPFASSTPTPATNNANLAVPAPTPIPTVNVVEEDEAPPTAWLDDGSNLGTPMRKAANTSTGAMPAGTSRFDTTSKLLRTSRVVEDADADPLANWVIVYGFQREDTKSILRKFSEYGTIVRQSAGRRVGNWMCLEYSTRMQAEKALCQSGTFHSADSIIGVRRADPKTVKEIGIDLRGPRGGVDDLMAENDGTIFEARAYASTSGKSDSTKSKDSQKEKSASKSDYDDILLPPKTKSSVIQKVLAWVFTW